MTYSREDKIVEIINNSANQRMSVEELARIFSTSPSTIRRDLARLSKEHRIVKIHGGAASIGGYLGNINFDRVDREYYEREEADIDIKNKIAKFATRFVKAGMCIYLDASTTVASMIPFLPHLNNVTYVTNSPILAMKLAEFEHKVYVTGGELKVTTNAYIGGYALDFLDKFNFSIGFFGTNGVHPKAGFTTPDPVEATIKMKAISRSYNIYILASHTKFDFISSATFCPIQNGTVISDSIPPSYSNILKSISLDQLKDGNI